MKIKYLISIVVINLIIALTPAFGQPTSSSLPTFMRAFETLDLTDDQRTQIREIMSSTRTEVSPLTNALNELRFDARLVVHSDHFDSERATLLASNIAQVESQIMLIRLKTQFDIRQILTPDQKLSLDQRAQQRKHKNRH